jgi:hypothetical protein
MENEVNENVENTSQPENTKTVPDLSLNDLAAVRSIIEVAVSRGAFKATELEAVGKAFNKLNVFLDSAAPKKE